MSEDYRNPNPVLDVLRHVEPFRTLRLRRRLAQQRRDEVPQTVQEQKFQQQHAFRRQPSYEVTLRAATQRIIERNGHAVLAGPFQGLRYIEKAFCSGYSPKLLGCYEDELHGVLEELIGARCEAVIIIGAAEGWYAAGLAQRLPNATIIAFEMDRAARRLCRLLAQKNGMSERIEVRGRCDVAALNQAFADVSSIRPERVLVICDCEGHEEKLMQPESVPGLRDCSLIIELHDCFCPGVSSAVTQRFRETHAMRLIESKYRDPHQIAASQFLPDGEREAAVDDRRGHWMQWAILSPLSNSE